MNSVGVVAVADGLFFCISIAQTNCQNIIKNIVKLGFELAVVRSSTIVILNRIAKLLPKRCR